MEEEKQIDPEQADIPVQGSGSILSAARKEQNKTVEDIAKELNLSVTQIRTIELDQSEGLPEPTYVRGYIRSYAKLLGLDPESVLENYLNANWQQSARLDDMPRDIGDEVDIDGGSPGGASKWVFLVILSLVLGFGWYVGWFDFSQANVSNPVQSSVMLDAQEQDLIEPTDSTIEAASNISQGESESLDDARIASADDEVELANELVLNFSETSWVDIRDQNDKRLAYKSYTQGEELIVSSPGSMSAFIGNAAGVQIQFNGAAFPVEPHREGVYAKFVVGKTQP